METAFVPLVGSTWRPVLLCGLLLASKVWQDLRLGLISMYNFFIFFIYIFFSCTKKSFHNSSWNIEFSQVYPQFTLAAINKLEVTYCKEIKWNLYISSSAYAKYYFALRSLTEKSDFRRYKYYDIILHISINIYYILELYY